MSKHLVDWFLEACGATGPLHLCIEGSGQQPAVHRILHQPFALIGRDPRADVPLDHAEVSQRHAFLQVIGGQVFGVDLQSRTGTHWDNGPRPVGWLDPGQTIRVGPFRIRLGAARRDSLRNPAEPAGSSALVTRSLDSSLLPPVTLELSEAGQQWLWRMKHVLALVGRSPHCKVQLKGPSVSRFHCSLLRTPAGVWVVDLFGRGGISVNGTRVRYARLEDRDELQVGSSVIRLWSDRAAGPPMPAGDLAPAGENLPAVVTRSSMPARLASSPEAGPGELLPASLVHHLGLMQEQMLERLQNQFGLMQQQMFDQFHQAMMMMVQMFNAMHQEQMEVIREEIDHLHQLTEDLQTLQAELARHPPNPRQRSGPGPATAAVQVSVTVPSFSSPSVADAYARADALVPASQEPAGAAAAVQLVQMNPLAGGDPGAPANQGAVSTSGAATKPAGPPAAGPLPPPVDRSSVDIHARLCQRIAAIQQERQNRWQGILNFLLGK